MNYTVLVVEDQWSLRKFAVLALQTSGYSALEAENGTQAIECLATHKVDLILTDWQMPEMNGEEFLKKIQLKQGRHYMPVVVMSCQKQPRPSEVDMKSLGILSWLQKPCRISTLRTVISGILDTNYKNAIN